MFKGSNKNVKYRTYLVKPKLPVKECYIYRESCHLPIYGWIQPCFHCYMNTSNTFVYKTVKKIYRIYRINLHLCPKCKKKYDTSFEFKNNVIIECEKYMKNKFTFL